MGSPQDVKEELLESDTNFRRLYEAHQRHERRLDEITRGSSLSIDDETTIKGIKVQKLHLKDQMEDIIRGHL